MARILITGSTDGLGLLAAQKLVANGHKVYLHARNPSRAADARAACPGAAHVFTADLSLIAHAKQLAADANALLGEGGSFDAVLHNAGVYLGPARVTSEGYPALVGVNVWAPWVLSCTMSRPRRVVFVSSGLHSGGDVQGMVGDPAWRSRAWDAGQAYADSKMANVMFASGLARRWASEGAEVEVEVNSLDPGWVPTKMGGAGASGSLERAVETYVRLAEGCGRSGGYWKPGAREARPSAVCEEERWQEELFKVCERETGVRLPGI